MSLKPFYNEQTVAVGEDCYRLVLDFRAIDAIEGLTGVSFNSTLEEITGEAAKLGSVGRVLWGLLREHHPEVTLDQAASLMFGDTGVLIGVAVQTLLENAFNSAPAETAKGKNPPTRRGVSPAS